MMTFPPDGKPDKPVLRRAALEEMGLSWRQIDKLLNEGTLERVGRGLYAWKTAPPSEHRTLAEAAVRVPHGVICLISALAFHGLGTQVPHEVWMAVRRGSRLPRLDWPPIVIVQFSGEAWSHGIEEHSIEGANVKITSAAKTVADCFKFRSKVGLDVAMEGLRDYLGRRGRTMDALFDAADACRVRKVMMPYVESLA